MVPGRTSLVGGLWKSELMIGLLRELDPLPTTFDHPNRILRRRVGCVNRHVVVLLTVFYAIERFE